MNRDTLEKTRKYIKENMMYGDLSSFAKLCKCSKNTIYSNIHSSDIRLSSTIANRLSKIVEMIEKRNKGLKVSGV